MDPPWFISCNLLYIELEVVANLPNHSALA